MSKVFVQSIGLTTLVPAGLIAAGTADAHTAPTQDGAALAQKHGCFNCHAVDTTKVGPPLKEAAAKYKGKSNAEAAAAIKASKAHSNINVPNADLESMNAWMQSGFLRAAGG